jgi:putative MATE family efflux protein
VIRRAKHLPLAKLISLDRRGGRCLILENDGDHTERRSRLRKGSLSAQDAGKKDARLIDGPVGTTLLKLTLPMIAAIVAMVSFNLVDALYVGRLGTRELAALSFTFPLVLFINSLAMGLGIGASAVISVAIGEGDQQKVRRLTTDSLLLALMIVAVCVFAGLLTVDDVFRFLGATPDLVPLITRYMRIWYFGMIFVVVPMVGNNAIRATGDTKTPAAIMLTAVAINSVLDPLLIFGIGPFPRLELAGAAIATVFARATTMSVALYILGRRERMLTFQRPAWENLLNSWKRILYIGLPSAGTRMIIPISVGVITGLLARFGPATVAAYGVSIRVEFFSLAAVAALAAVIGPFVGQNLGAGRYGRMALAIKYGKAFSLGWGAAICLVLALAARPIASVFNDDPGVIATIALYLRIVPLSYGLQGILLLSTAAMNVLNKPLQAAALTIVQMFLCCVPLAYIGSGLFGPPGAFGAISLAYLMAGIAAHFLLNHFVAEKRRSSVGIVSASQMEER